MEGRRGSRAFTALAGVAAAAAAFCGPAPARPAAADDGAWRVVPAESFVGYRVRERLTFLPVPNDAVGRTSAIVGTAEIRSGSITRTKVSADVRTLKSDQSRRDRTVRETLVRRPAVVFTLTKPLRLPSVPAGTGFALRAPGTLLLNGVARNVIFPLRVRLTSTRLQVVGSLPIKFADYEIDRPQIGPVLSVSDTAKIEVQLSFARA